MLKIFYNKFINRTVCLILVGVFLSTFPTGATALVLCLGDDENHKIEQNFYLADCHSSVDANQLLSGEHCFTFAEKENNDCVDVSLTNDNTLNRPSRVMLPGFAKTVISYTLPGRLIGFQQQVVENYSFVLSQANPLRTVVLLI